MCSYNENRDLAQELLDDKLQLWQLPRNLRGLYFLGEQNGYAASQEATRLQIEALESECDWLYRLATQGDKAKPQLHKQPTYTELYRLRGEPEKAHQIEAELQLLADNPHLTRSDLTEKRSLQTLKR